MKIKTFAKKNKIKIDLLEKILILTETKIENDSINESELLSNLLKKYSETVVKNNTADIDELKRIYQIITNDIKEIEREILLKKYTETIVVHKAWTEQISIISNALESLQYNLSAQLNLDLENNIVKDEINQLRKQVNETQLSLEKAYAKIDEE